MLRKSTPTTERSTHARCAGNLSLRGGDRSGEARAEAEVLRNNVPDRGLEREAPRVSEGVWSAMEKRAPGIHGGEEPGVAAAMISLRDFAIASSLRALGEPKE